MSGTHYNGGCCFDYGNSENNQLVPWRGGAGSMEVCLSGASFPMLGCSFDECGNIEHRPSTSGTAPGTKIGARLEAPIRKVGLGPAPTWRRECITGAAHRPW